MEIYSTTKARENLFKLVENVEHEPIIIVGRRRNAVLISQEDYQAILETLHISSVPGLVQSIVAESKAPISEFSDKIDWGNV